MTRWKGNWKQMSESEKKDAEKLLRLLGLCARARRLVYGTMPICDGLRDKKEILLVLMAEGVSENTRKRLSDRCQYYGVRLESAGVSPEVLAHVLGRGGELAAVGVTDKHFAAGLEALLG